jgi:hypothetical protein
MEIYTELVPFDAALAQRMSDRAVKVITATEAGELLPRAFNDQTHFECRMCAWQDRCWRKRHEPFTHQVHVAVEPMVDASRRPHIGSAAVLLHQAKSRAAKRIPHYRVGRWCAFGCRNSPHGRPASAQAGGTGGRRMLDFNDTPAEPTENQCDAERRFELRAELLARLESVLATLFPAGKKRKGKFLIGDVLGSPGDSLEVVLDGEKAGLWTDRATGDGGDIFDLIAAHLGANVQTDFPRVLQHAADLLGQARSTPVPQGQEGATRR